MDTNALILAIVIALVGAIAPTMVAYNGLQQSKLNAVKTAENTALTVAASEKIDAVGDQTKEIHTATNGTLSKMEERLKNLTEQNASMQATNVSMQATIKSLVERETKALPAREEVATQSAAILEKVTESGKMNGDVAEFMRQFSELFTEMKETQAQVKSLIADREP